MQSSEQTHVSAFREISINYRRNSNRPFFSCSSRIERFAELIVAERQLQRKRIIAMHSPLTEGWNSQVKLFLKTYHENSSSLLVVERNARDQHLNCL